MAASPIGTLIQKIARQLIASMSAPPTTGPEAERQPDDATPHADRLRPLARFGEHVGDDRHRDRIEHRAADRLQRAERDQPAERRAPGCTATSRARRSTSPVWKVRLAVRAGRPSRPESISRLGQHHGVGVDRPLQIGTATRAGRLWMELSATLTIVLSMPTISRLMQQITRIVHAAGGDSVQALRSTILSSAKYCTGDTYLTTVGDLSPRYRCRR